MPNNERERRMSMLRAALPYTSGNQRHALQMVLQIDTLISTARRGTANDLEACDVEAAPEEMLLQIQEFCTPRESDMVQTILNFIKANHLFQNYREFMASHPDNQESGELQAASIPRRGGTNPINMLFQLFGGLGGGNSGHLMEFLITQLPPEQKQLFEQIQTLSEAGMFTQNQDSQTAQTGQSSPDGFSADEQGQQHPDDGGSQNRS